MATKKRRTAVWGEVYGHWRVLTEVVNDTNHKFRRYSCVCTKCGESRILTIVNLHNKYLMPKCQYDRKLIRKSPWSNDAFGSDKAVRYVNEHKDE
jgi:hypothetical protein